MGYIIMVTARSIAVHTGGLAKKSILACGDTNKTRIGQNPKQFLETCLKPFFTGLKIKKNFFSRRIREGRS